MIAPRLARVALVVAMGVCPLFVVSGAVAQQASEPVAYDGQRLSGQPADTQAAFTATWGDKASGEWASEHTHALIVAGLAALGLKPSFRTVYPDMPPDPADTTPVKLNTTRQHAPAVGDLIDIDQQAHLMYLGNGDEDAIEVFDVSTPAPRWLRAFHVPGGVAGIRTAMHDLSVDKMDRMWLMQLTIERTNPEP